MILDELYEEGREWNCIRFKKKVGLLDVVHHMWWDNLVSVPWAIL